MRGQKAKKEIHNVTGIFAMTHDRNIFLTLKEELLLSKGYFTPMINNSRLATSPRLYGRRALPITDVTRATLYMTFRSSESRIF